MKFTYTCKKVSLNDSVKAYAEKKVGKLEKFFKEEPEASVTFSVEKKNRCVAEIMLRGANGTLFRAVCEDPDGDMRGAIDEATAQIERKIRKNKTRLAKNLRAEAVLPELPEEFEAHEEEQEGDADLGVQDLAGMVGGQVLRRGLGLGVTGQPPAIHGGRCHHRQ